MRLSAIALSTALLASLACGTAGQEDGAGPSGKADGFTVTDLVDGTAPAVGLLRFLNDPVVGPIVMEVHLDLPGNAAANILEHRDGAGLLSNPFDDIAEVDGVPGVGPATLQRILDFADAHNYVPKGDDNLGTWDGVAFSVNEANAVLAIVNTASADELDDEIGLDSRSVDIIVEERPLPSVLVLADVSHVGASSLSKLKDAADVPEPNGAVELGIISDLDKTIIPPAATGEEFPEAPYPGMAELLTALEFGPTADGNADDIHFVTARQPDRVVGVPDWLAEHGVPTGEISTGISGIPFVASEEKIRDIKDVFTSRPADQSFVMFGDSSHADPDAYRAIVEEFGDKIVVAFIHDVKTIDSAKLAGLVLINNYAEAADRLLDEELLTEQQATVVMQAVVRRCVDHPG